ncbi:Signal transduction histidine kinase regulating C4-dicarboxylate transport system [Methylobacterium phyllostachyos]|uniref:histidine kinase n=1 Tax=Methylobacterium phyllostachyos TaxID=582672 RepID=A0A1G9Z0S0_9HYPH|nr:ATP-binding protein [Methylobacterium phyllostachyos]SDN14924.1 Signal transduction histidine kinase regulating C4-dicarboxylate transport system [Methylobacterium phyllostachyos]
MTASPPLDAPGPSARKPFRLPLSGKFAVAFVGLVSLVLLINGAVDLSLNFQEAKLNAITVQREKAQGAAERVEAFVSEIGNQIGWTTRAEWRRVPPDQQRYDFIRLMRQAPAITEAAYIDPSGREQLRVSRLEPDVIASGKDFSTSPRFTEALKDKVWFGPVYFRRGSEPYMTVAVAHAGRDPGVTVAEVNLKLIWDVVSSIRNGETGYAFVTTSTGRLIAHPDLSLVLRDTDLSGLPEVAAALPGNGSAQDYEITTGLGGGLVLAAHAAIPRVGWIVFVQLPLREAMDPLIESVIQTVALMGLGVLLASVAGTFLARRMVVPIRQLQDGAERFGAGDLSERIVIRTGDEIETLAHRFNLMAGRIQESYETLEAKVEERTRDLNRSLDDLQKAQSRLVQSEKLASLGQLTAGIAHEIKNPLNFVNNFASLSKELVDELIEVLKQASLDPNTRADAEETAELLKSNLDRVVQHGKRADSIVKNMLLHSRTGSGEHRPVDVNALVEESLNLAYHGARAAKPTFNVTLERDFDPAAGVADIFPQEITRVLLNLMSNGFYATEKKVEGGELGYAPTLAVATRDRGDRIEIRVRDNGTGIPDSVKAKMFDPFFTTKPAGEGTGLGLSLSHDILVKQHGGSVDVATEPGEFTEFTITLPRAGAATAESATAGSPANDPKSP